MSSSNNEEKHAKRTSGKGNSKKVKRVESKSFRYQFYSILKNNYLDKLDLKPLKDAFQKPAIILRKSAHSDVPQLSKLVTDHTQEMFGDFDLHYIIEMCNFCLCQTTKNGDIVAFVATTSIPNIPAVPPVKWIPLVEDFYGMNHCTSKNTSFLHMILWHEKYKDHFMEQFLRYLYMNDVMLQYIFVIVPPGVTPFRCLTPDLFTCLLPRENTGAEDKVQKLYLNDRLRLIPKIKIRKTIEEDNIDIMPHFDETAPILRDLYGDYFLSEILRFSSDTRFALTGLLKGKCCGFVLLSKKISYKTIQNYFEVNMFNGFRKKHVEDMIPKKTKRSIIQEVDIDVPDKIEFVKLNEAAEAQTQETVPPSAPQTSTVERLSSDHSFSEESILIMDTKSEKEEEPKTFQLPPIVSPGQYVQTPSMSHSINLLPSEIFPKGGLLAHSGLRNDRVIPYGVPPPIIEYGKNQEAKFYGEGNAVLIEIFMICKGIDFRLGYDFLEVIFEVAPDVEYCLISLPSDVPVPPLVNYFDKAPQKIGMSFPHELYYIHRNCVLSEIRVRGGFPGDVMSVMELTSQMEKNRVIRDDFLDSITKKATTNLRSYVLLSENVVGGLCIISRIGYDTTLLESQFDIDRRITPALHPHYAFIKHLIMSPIFAKQTPLLLREVLRYAQVTCLYYTLYDETIMKSDQMRITLTGVLQYLYPISPRKQLQYQPIEKMRPTSYAEECVTEEGDYLAPIRTLQEFEKGLPFALFYTTNRLAAVFQKPIHTKIVVVGGSETAISFIESLIFRVHKGVHFSNITLVSPHGMPFYQKPHEARDAMSIFTGRYNHRFMIQLGLYAWVNVVYGYMTEINREEKHIVIDYKNIVPYDLLFLFCGLQFTKPLPQLLHRDKTASSKSKFIQKYLDDYPENLFLVVSSVDASHSLNKVNKFVKENTNPEARIIIYGHYLKALAVVNALLLFGVPPNMMAFVESFPSQPSVTLFNNIQIDDAVLKSITNTGVELYMNCHFSRWEKIDNSIKKVTFESVTKTVVLECLCMFAFAFKSVDIRTFIAVIKAGLVFDGRLVIDKNFRTNDPFIYSAGPLTKYKRKYFADHLNHEYYNSAEIGVMMFKMVERSLDPSPADDGNEGFDADDKQKKQEEDEIAETAGIVDLPELTRPKIKYCLLPGGWKYLHVYQPGIKTPLECQLNSPIYFGPVYVTGDCENEDGPGYFRLAFSNVSLVCEITCYTKQDIEVDNFVKLYGKHISLLNNVYQRFNLGAVPDLYEYFRQSWTYAIYHDRFEAVENKETELFHAENINPSKGPFVEVITDLLESVNYSPLNDIERNVLREEFRNTGIVQGIQKTIKEYLIESKFHLPMYISDEYIIVQTANSKRRHLHSKPDNGLTREDLLRFKEESLLQKEDETNEEEHEEAELEEEWDDLYEFDEFDEESLTSSDNRPHVEFEPKRQQSYILPQPPKEEITMTETPGFCVLSCLRLHKDLTKCKYCNKYIPEDAEKHLLIHKNEKSEESLQGDLYVPEYDDNMISMLETKEEEEEEFGPKESFDLQHKSLDNQMNELNYVPDPVDDLPNKKSINSNKRQDSINEERGRKSSSLKLSLKSIKTLSAGSSSTSILDLKVPDCNTVEVGQNLEMIRNLHYEEKLREEEKKRVFDKMAKSWLRYYN